MKISPRKEITFADQDFTVRAYLIEIGVTFDVSYQGATNKCEWECDRFTFTFSRNNRKLRSKYFTGVGHRFIKTMSNVLSSKSRAELIRYYGDNNVSAHYSSTQEEYSVPCGRSRMLYVPHPTSASVLYSLLMDADAHEYSFDGWCCEFGYDTDSVKATTIYRNCCDMYHKLRNIFSKEEIAKLGVILEGY